jgi:dolichol-phosphate mannosyltransferase
VAHRRALWRRFGAAAYFLVLRKVLRAGADPTQGAFSVVSKRAREAFLQVPDRDRHYVPILHWIGFEQAYVDYEPKARGAGESAYTFRSLLQLAIEGMFFQTTTLLRFVIYSGFGICVLGFGLALYDAYARIFLHPPSGFTSLSILLLVLSGFIILSSGIAGLYIGQIFQQVKGRPLYVIEQELCKGVSQAEKETTAAVPSATRSQP